MAPKQNRKYNTSKNKGSLASKLNIVKGRKVFHQPNPPQNPMTLNDEDAAIDLCYMLFCVVTLHLGPCVWNFLTSRLLFDQKSTVVDTYEFLKIIIDLRSTNASFFTTNSPSDLSNLQTAQNGRLAIAHGYLDEVSRNWISYLLSWVEVLKMIDEHGAAAVVQKIHDELTSGSKTPLDIVLSFTSKPDFMNRGFSLRRETDLTKAQYFKAIRVKMALYKCMIINLAPALRSENLRRTGRSRTDSEIDCQNLLFDLLEFWLQKPQYPDTMANVHLIEKAKGGRNVLCHEKLAPILADWESFLVYWSQVCTLISDPSAAKAINEFHSKLKSEIEMPLTGQIANRTPNFTVHSNLFVNIVRKQSLYNPAASSRRPNHKILLTRKPT